MQFKTNDFKCRILRLHFLGNFLVRQTADLRKTEALKLHPNHKSRSQSVRILKGYISSIPFTYPLGFLSLRRSYSQKRGAEKQGKLCHRFQYQMLQRQFQVNHDCLGTTLDPLPEIFLMRATVVLNFSVLSRSTHSFQVRDLRFSDEALHFDHKHLYGSLLK